MSLLVYCVLNGHRGPARPSVRGVHNQPVWVLECGRLCAAVSDAENESDFGSPTDMCQPERSPAQLDALLAYARTVEAFSRGETIVPMRYGCRLGTINEVRAWVAGRAAELRGLLDRLEGCVEMGVRILPSRASTPRRAAAAAALRAAAAAPRNAGAAYLAARRTELALEDWIEQAAQDARSGLCALARDCVMETAAPDSRPMALLYFLVEKAKLTGFRAAFARIAAAADAAMLLSGPWPPYTSSAAVQPATPLLRSPLRWHRGIGSQRRARQDRRPDAFTMTQARPEIADSIPVKRDRSGTKGST
jgi:hypothetical protein